MLLLGDLFRIIAKRHPENTSIVYEDLRFTFRETDTRINRLANGLLDLGVKKGDRVAIMQTDCHQYVELDFAVARIGAVYVPLNYRLRETEIEYLVNDSGSTIFFVGDRYAPLIDTMRNRMPAVQHYICFEGTVPSMLKYEDLVSQGNVREPLVEGISDQDLVNIQYSSGTTGLPKGAMLTHQALVNRMMIGSIEYRLTPEDRVYVSAPMFHVSGFGLHVPTLLAGGTAYMLKQFDPRLVAETIQQEKLTGCFLVPSMINFILTLPDIDQFDLSSLRLITYGAAPMPVDLLRKAMQKMDCQFYNLFGAGTEGGLQSYLRPADHKLEGTEAELRRLGSIGKPPSFVDVRIIDGQGGDVQPGEVGEIISKSGQNM
ncbi:MAG: AMP-binding protein, partial [Bacillota bacterium]